MTQEQENIIRDIVGLVKILDGGILTDKFDIRTEARSMRFNQMRITGVREEKYLIKKFRLKI